MKRLGLYAFAALALLLAANPVQARNERTGYLAPDAVDIVKILPPAPVQGEGRYDADREIFKATRRFVGSPRWDLATSDVETSTADMLRNYSCAVGVALDPENAPHLVQLMEKAGTDTSHASGFAKNYFKRLRPYQIDEGKTCQPAVQLAGSFDYPSGHTTWGWTWASLLAELAPDRASAILARGRSFGESRIVCGVHNNSAVEAGKVTASAVLAVVHSSEAFQADLKAARQELDALRGAASATPLQGCADEAALIAEPIF